MAKFVFDPIVFEETVRQLSPSLSSQSVAKWLEAYIPLAEASYECGQAGDPIEERIPFYKNK